MRKNILEISLVFICILLLSSASTFAADSYAISQERLKTVQNGMVIADTEKTIRTQINIAPEIDAAVKKINKQVETENAATRKAFKKEISESNKKLEENLQGFQKKIDGQLAGVNGKLVTVNSRLGILGNAVDELKTALVGLSSAAFAYWITIVILLAVATFLGIFLPRRYNDKVEEERKEIKAKKEAAEIMAGAKKRLQDEKEVPAKKA